MVSKRSMACITKRDLRRLLVIAEDKLDDLFLRKPELRPYRRRLVAICLCQGAALHYVDHVNSIKDFDIFAFFAVDYDARLANRRGQNADYGRSKFGVHPGDTKKGYTGRRIDFFRRAIGEARIGRDVGVRQAMIQSYLKAGRTKTSRCLAEKAVVGLWPEELLGWVI